MVSKLDRIAETLIAAVPGSAVDEHPGEWLFCKTGVGTSTLVARPASRRGCSRPKAVRAYGVAEVGAPGGNGQVAESPPPRESTQFVMSR